MKVPFPDQSNPFSSDPKKLERIFQNAHAKNPGELLIELSNRSSNLKERYHILSIASKASCLIDEKESRSQEEVAREAHNLKGRIDAFLKVHRPSHKDICFLRFARECLEKAETEEKITFFNPKEKKEVDQETFLLAEELYNLAGMLYNGEYDLFDKSFNDMPLDIKDEIHYHITICEGDLLKRDLPIERMRLIQSLLGYAHFLTDYYTGNTPYPSFVEIHETFRDLAFVNYIEEEEK